jgi:ligand-binding SRPBCC domain-containing protein
MDDVQIKHTAAGYQLSQAQWLPGPPDEVFKFFENPFNLEKITPKRLHFEVKNHEPEKIQEGTTIEYKLTLHGIPIEWISEISDYSPPRYFTDRQVKGPYKKWVHTHTFDEVRGGSLIGDQVYYEMPLGPIGRMAHWYFVENDLKDIFQYRRRKLFQLLTPE